MLARLSLYLVRCFSMVAGAAAAMPSGAAAPAPAVTSLATVRQSMQMPWNAVVVDARGRFIVAAPRWTGYTGPAVAVVDAQGRLQPYPDAGWSQAAAGTDAAHRLVSVNAIHQDSAGGVWIVDTGSLSLGGRPLVGGAKILHVDPQDDRVQDVYILPPAALRAHSYIDDIRLHGRRAYLTDAGEGALLVLDLDSGQVRRRFDGMAWVRAGRRDRIVVQGHLVRSPDGRPLQVQVDPLELSPDGRTLYFGPLTGPLWQVDTRSLDDNRLDDAAVAGRVRPWFALPPVGGTAMAPDGSLYYTPLADGTVMRRDANGRLSVVVRDPRLRWADAPFLDGRGHLYLPVPQLDGAAIFHHGVSTVHWPVGLYRIDLPARPGTP